MTSQKQQYEELLALTQLYLLQEYPRKDWIFSDAENYAFFKKQAAQQQKKQNPPPLAPMPVPQKASIPVKQEAPPQPAKAPPIEPKTTPACEVKPEKPMPKEETVKVVAASSEPPKKISKPTGFFTLEPLSPAKVEDLSDLRKIISEKFPGINIIDTIPDDGEAKKICSAWKNQSKTLEVIILSFNETPKQKTFLQNIAKAIQLRLASTSIVSAQKIEADKGWAALLETPSLRLIIAPDYGIYSLPELMKQYRESPVQARRFLGNVPLCLLTDLSLYMREPKLKPSLWKAICAAMI